MYTQEAVLDLVELIYASSFDRTMWPRVLDRLRLVMGASGTDFCSFDLSRPSTIITYSNGIVDAAFRHEYLTHFIQADPWVVAARRHNLFKAGTVGVGEEVVATSDLKKTPFFNEFGRRYDYVGGITAIIGGDGVKGSALNVCRAPNRSFGAEEVRLLRTLMPHLERALQVHEKIADCDSRVHAFEEALNQLVTGALLVDQSCRVLFANHAALAILAEQDGLTLRKDALEAHTARDTAFLRTLIGGAGETVTGKGLLSGGVALLARPSGRRPLQVTVAPPPPREEIRGLRRSCAVVFVVDPEATPEPDVALLARTYGFTRAESEIVRLVLLGQSIQEITGSLDLTAHTVRSYFKQLFAKTGTHRQAEFVRLMMMSTVRKRA